MPPTVNKKLHSRSVLNQIRLLRFSNAVTQKILKFLQEVDNSLTDAIGKRLLNIKTSGVSPDTFKNKRLQALQQFVRSAISKQSKDLYDIMKPALIDTANKELNWQVENIADVLPVKVDVVTPPKPLLEALVTENPFEGKVLQDWVSGWETGKAERVLAEIKKGMAEGQAAEDIVTRLAGTKALQYSDGVLDISRRGARALVRTTVNGLATAARELFYKQNEDIIKGVQWVSTLDSRTTPICQARDGKVYPIDSGPRPPAHVNCLPGNTLIIPVGDITSAYKRVYKGDVIIIITASGLHLTCTPNHPILTQRGWIAAKLLNKSDQVFKVTNKFFCNYLINTVENSIEEILNTFCLSAFTKKVVTTYKDFHGDGIDKDTATMVTNKVLPYTMQKYKNYAPSDFELYRQIFNKQERFIERDNIIGISKEYFSGYVYNLETVNGYYIANGIITHNCRSTTCPVMKSWKDMGIDLNEVPEGTRPAVVNGVAGDVPASMTYEEWLKEQSEEVQKDILGQKKYDLWKNGATLGSFVDETTGKSKKL